MFKGFYFWSIIGCLIPLAGVGQVIDTLAMDFGALVEEHRYPIQLTSHKIVGAGGDRLVAEAQGVEVFMFGENHGIQEIAQLARLLYKEISLKQARILVTEIGPATAAEVEEMIRKRTYRSFMKKNVNLLAVPFFFLEEEVPLLETAIGQFPNENPCIWGLDQEFIAGAPIVLQHLEKYTQTKEEKEALNKAYRTDFFNPFMIGMGSGEALKELEVAFSSSNHKEARNLTEKLVLSHKIYKANATGQGRWSNATRESLMMENFEQYTQHYSNTIPPLFFKFGAYHLHKGSSPTVKEALGLRIDTWAKERNWKTLNVFVDAVEGQTLDPLLGTSVDLPTLKLWETSIFKGKLINNQPTLFDLRPLRNHSKVEQMSTKIQHLIKGYDYLILFPKGTPQHFLPGTLITYRYGSIVLGIVIIIVIGLIFVIRRSVRRYRNKKRLKRSA